MLIVLLIAWIVIVPALVVGFATYAGARRERPAAEAGVPRPSLRSRVAAVAHVGAPHPTA